MNVRTHQVTPARQAISVPHPGDNDQPANGELTAWYVEVGETVRPGQRLFQVSWPGLVIDYTADAAGIVANRCGRLRERITPDATLLELRLASAGSADNRN